MSAAIDTLINTPDNFELVGSQIADVIKLESVNQVALATTAGEPDPTLWGLNVYSERANPFEKFLTIDTDASPDLLPIVNVAFDSSTYDASSGNTFESQKCDATYNIMIACYGESSADPAGHLAGDKQATINLHRAYRLVRNILMSAQYIKLGMGNGLIWGRWPDSFTVFTPEIGGVALQQITAGLFKLRVGFLEFAPQYTPETLECICIDFARGLDGLVIAEADITYPL